MQFNYRLESNLLRFPIFNAMDIILKEYNLNNDPLVLDNGDDLLNSQYNTYRELSKLVGNIDYTTSEHLFICRKIYSLKGIDNSLISFASFYGLGINIARNWGTSSIIVTIDDLNQDILDIPLFGTIMSKFINELLYFNSSDIRYGTIIINYPHNKEFNIKYTKTTLVEIKTTFVIR